jgi:hypothetical protein
MSLGDLGSQSTKETYDAAFAWLLNRSSVAVPDPDLRAAFKSC